MRGEQRPPLTEVGEKLSQYQESVRENTAEFANVLRGVDDLQHRFGPEALKLLAEYARSRLDGRDAKDQVLAQSRDLVNLEKVGQITLEFLQKSQAVFG